MQGLNLETILSLETEARLPLYRALSEARLVNARLQEQIAVLKALNAVQAKQLQEPGDSGQNYDPGRDHPAVIQPVAVIRDEAVPMAINEITDNNTH